MQAQEKKKKKNDKQLFAVSTQFQILIFTIKI